MGREVRLVPADWQHPKDEQGHYIPLLSGPYSVRLVNWQEENEKWLQGLRRDWSADGKVWKPIENRYKEMSFSEWDGECPVLEDYMPEWKPEECTHYQMYENTTEGTPISPVMETPEILAQWLVDYNASAFGNQGASYEGWLRIAQGGYAPSMVVQGNVITSGVDGVI